MASLALILDKSALETGVGSPTRRSAFPALCWLGFRHGSPQSEWEQCLYWIAPLLHGACGQLKFSQGRRRRRLRGRAFSLPPSPFFQEQRYWRPGPLTLTHSVSYPTFIGVNSGACYERRCSSDHSFSCLFIWYYMELPWYAS